MRNWKKIKLFFKLAWKISPSYIFLLVLHTLLLSGQSLINILLPKFLIDELIGAQRQNYLLLWVGIIILGNFLLNVIKSTVNRFLEIKSIYVREMMSQAMAEKIMNVEFAHLEDPYYLDLKERAIFAINNQNSMESFIQSIASMLRSIVTLLGLITILFTLHYILILILLGTILITLFLNKKFLSYTMQFFKEILPVNRKYGYYINLAFDEKIQKDVRLYQMNNMLTDRVTTYNREINQWFSRYYKKQGLFMGITRIIQILQSAIANIYVGLRVITDRFGPRITIGEFSMYVNASVQFTSQTVGFVENLMNLIQTLGYLDPYMEFMELPNEEDQQGTVPFEGPIETITFDHVSFKYPKSEKLILNDLSFEIKKGEKISIVGLNGAGKTTLIKLLCRLYRPTEGTISINGRDIFEYEHRSYMKEIAAVFQDYKVFAFSIEENITCAPYQADEAAKLMIEKVGLKEKVEGLTNQMASYFGKAYDEEGIEMSGGQSQKIAIARALYKNASLIILDEPTSALDPIAEAEVYAHFNELVGEQTALYISHRMSSSIFCDKILVIDQGKITDYDSHRNLMKKTESLYYKLFNAQAVNYQV